LQQVTHLFFALLAGPVSGNMLTDADEFDDLFVWIK
jgi:hypothetical protein